MFFCCINVLFCMNTSVVIVHIGLYASDIGWGRGFYIVHETVRRQ